VPLAAPGLTQIGPGDPLPAVAARVGEHRLETPPRGRVAGLALVSRPLRRAHAVVEIVTRALQRGQVEQAGRAAPEGRRRQGLAGRGQPALEDRKLPAQGAARGALVDLDGQRQARAREGRGPRQPPMGARGLAPQKTWVPSIPIRWMSTMFTTIDFAVAVPTPTGPPPAW
jgi:hypothetical protein